MTSVIQRIIARSHVQLGKLITYTSQSLAPCHFEWRYKEKVPKSRSKDVAANVLVIIVMYHLGPFAATDTKENLTHVKVTKVKLA